MYRESRYSCLRTEDVLISALSIRQLVAHAGIGWMEMEIYGRFAQIFRKFTDQILFQAMVDVSHFRRRTINASDAVLAHWCSFHSEMLKDASRLAQFPPAQSNYHIS